MGRGIPNTPVEFLRSMAINSYLIEPGMTGPGLRRLPVYVSDNRSLRIRYLLIPKMGIIVPKLGI